MSGTPVLEVVDGRGLRVAVVAALWHNEVMEGLLAGSLRALTDCGLDNPLIIRVPGSFELPVAASRLARAGYDAVVALGVVVQGESPHFDYVCQGATVGLTDVSTSTGVPVGFGVLTCDTYEQAYDRSGLPGATHDKGYEAALSAVITAVALRSVT